MKNANATIRLAGKAYRFRYQLVQRDEIERAIGGDNALLGIMLSGKLRDQATIVWSGIKAADPDQRVTPRGIIEEFQKHNDKGGDYYQDVYCVAAILACESGLLGRKADVEELKRLLDYQAPEGKDEAEPPAAVRAAE